MVLYFIVKYVQPFIDNTFIDGYFTDLLFVPAMSLFALIGVRFIKRDNTITIPLHLILLQTLLVGMYFELYLPTQEAITGNYTSDPIDVLMYILGGGLFFVLQRQFLRSSEI